MMTRHQANQVKRFPIGAIFLTYALLTIGFTYPLVVYLTKGLPHHNRDVWIALWNNWWLHKALTTAQSYYFTPYLFYPHGVSLATHSNSLLPSAFSALLIPFLGQLGAFNLTFFLTFPLGALGMYLLVCDLTHRPLAAFVAGVTYAFAPYYLTQGMAHPSLGSVGWLPYTALFLRRAMLEGRTRAGLTAGFFFALTVWSGLQIGLLNGLWVGLFVMWTLATERRARRRTSLMALAEAALIASLLSLPALLPVLRTWTPDQKGVLLIDRETGQTDLLAYFIPPWYHPIWKRLVTPIYTRFANNKKWMPYVGFVPIGLASYAALKERRKASFWWFSALLWMILALGAFLRVDGRVFTQIPLPFSLVDRLFPFNTLRSSDRFNLLVPLSLGVLVGLALTRVQRPWWCLVAVALIGLEYLCAPLPVHPPAEPSPFLLQMAADPEPYTVLDLPMGRSSSKVWMYLQTFHEKPLVEGMVARLPPDTYSFIESVPLLHAFRHDYKLPPSPPARDMCLLANSGIRYVLIHTDMATPDKVQRWIAWFPFPPIYQDNVLIVFATSDGCKVADADSSSSMIGSVPQQLR